MPKRAAGLTAAKVRTAKPGTYVDGDGLMLFVRTGKPDREGKPTASRFWLMRYSYRGKRREAGFGRAGEGSGEVSLAQARERAAEWRRLLKAGIDPLVQREAEEAHQKAEAQARAAQAMTFRDVAAMFMGAKEAGWRNAKHRAQWKTTLETYVFPHMGDLPVGKVETAHIMAALEAIWTAKPETASRVRGRIEAVLDYATARGWRTGENPARWRGHVANMLPSRSELAPEGHHAALPWREAGVFMAELGKREVGSTAALALRFTILTAARSGETLGARWREIDLDEGVWTVPAERMKARREHRVPLNGAALTVLRQAAKLRTSDDPAAFLFPGQASGRPLSVMAMTMVLRRMGRGDLTVHGFRSTFRDWAAETTSFDGATAEMALAHTLRDKTEAAYRRGDLFEKRCRLMDAWARHCATVSTGKATPIRLRTREAVG
ncbi:MAG TPA: integrase arm-type DNA-binding domain-containing protein [Rhodocyclaceae bacterium]|nr:integrase arm-type DNA-binding domain-containing protein [Rhodocyclaceae bacterium]